MEAVALAAKVVAYWGIIGGRAVPRLAFPRKGRYAIRLLAGLARAVPVPDLPGCGTGRSQP